MPCSLKGGGDKLDLPKRKSNRLKGFTYNQNGAYFITICIKDRQPILWNIDNVGATCGRPYHTNHLSAYGLLIENEINRIDSIYNHVVEIDKYVIMPNHIHLLILLHTNNGRPQVAPTISRIMKQFKGSVTKQIGFPLWQKLFHDHIIRNEQDYLKIWEYIDTNPLRWETDCFYKI